MTLADFRIELEHLHDAMSTVKGCTASIENDVNLVKQVLNLAEGVWQSPSGATFGNLQRDFGDNMSVLVDLLREMSTRLHTAYEEYRQVEETNTKNFQHQH
ncbi:WXG100 family type VII secretion target [Streptomyces catenulae]|uniref:WXG100 family type VII secretion target n=1 Tax=Streptomyces catenulae TaxID=66875 RepID=A0ABV2YSF8_9ACTN|nr:WXG100 family type VII secretion target [Streptomyces catenulae]